jgi:cytochrome b involved in lipid metabolism
MQVLASIWNYFFEKKEVQPLIYEDIILFEELYSKNTFTPIISEEELKIHDEKNDEQWIVLEGKVVDITKWKVCRKYNYNE